MFEKVSVFGTRAAVWHPTKPARLPGRLLLPGGGSTLCDDTRAMSPTASSKSGGRRTRPTDRTRSGGSPSPNGPGLHRLDDPRPEATAARKLGVFVPEQNPVDFVAADRLLDEQDDLRWASAVLDLAHWRCKMERTAPGPDLAAMLTRRPERLAPAAGQGRIDDGQLWADAVLASVVAREKLISHLQASQYTDLAELSARYPGIHQFLATEVALALGTTEATAASMLGTAGSLRDRLPQTLSRLSDGSIDHDKAMALVHATTSTTAEVAGLVEQRVLPGAVRISPIAVRRRAERAVIELDPAGAAERHRVARSERHVSRRPDVEGMGRLSVLSTMQDIAVVWEALTALAEASRRPNDDRDLGARRVDALVQVCSDILAGGGWTGLRLPERPGRKPHIQVTIPFSALLGTDEPCDLTGFGPITADQARQIAADSVLTRLVCDPLSGVLLDYGRTRYKPPESLKAFVRARDAECILPICHQPATRNHLDHVIPARPDPVTGLPTLGTTSADNLCPPCAHHHLSKDADRGFHLSRDPDGSYTWTTPLGRSYTQQPHQLWRPPPPSPDAHRERDGQPESMRDAALQRPSPPMSARIAAPPGISAAASPMASRWSMPPRCVEELSSSSAQDCKPVILGCSHEEAEPQWVAGVRRPTMPAPGTRLLPAGPIDADWADHFPERSRDGMWPDATPSDELDTANHMSGDVDDDPPPF